MQVDRTGAARRKAAWSSAAFNRVYQFFVQILPGRYPNEASLPIESPGNYPEVRLAINGDIADAVRRRADGGAGAVGRGADPALPQSSRRAAADRG